jgi:hypothetical protein
MAGCKATPTSGQAPSNPCEFGAVVFDVGPVDFCAKAVALAQVQLGWLHWPVASTSFRSEICPPNARCVGDGADDEGWVVFTFSIGDPSMIHVGPDANGVVVAGVPEAPPDWLMDELNAREPSRQTGPQGG